MVCARDGVAHDDGVIMSLQRMDGNFPRLEQTLRCVNFPEAYGGRGTVPMKNNTRAERRRTELNLMAEEVGIL